MSDINIVQITEALNDKSDRDLRNVDTTAKADAVIEYQEPTSANNYTWYRKYKSGWVEQGGISTSSTTINLPITMSDTNYSILLGNDYYSSGAGTAIIVYYSKTTTGFGAQGRWNGAGQAGINFSWQVSGMAAN